MPEDAGWKKWGALVVFAVQNAGAVLLMRYSKLLHGPPYSNLAAVMVQELIKLGVSTVLYANECRGLGAMVEALRADLQENSGEWLQLAVPSLLYTLQNVMLFVGAAHLEAAIAQVTYQAKIFFTALFSVALLGKRLTSNQWLSLALLVLGVLCVQGVVDNVLTMTAAAAGPPAQVPMLGIGAMLLAAICSSFASVYFEKMLKASKKPSLWLRNMQLACYSTLIAMVSLACTDDPARGAGGLLHGFNGVTWCVVLTQSLGGIIVAVCIKYADNILRTFSQTVAVILGAFGSYFLFDFHFTLSFNAGMVLVGLAIVLYGHKATTPDESYRACAGCLCPPSTEL